MNHELRIQDFIIIFLQSVAFMALIYMLLLIAWIFSPVVGI